MLRSQTSGYCVMQPLSRSSSSVSSCCSGLRENETSEEEENDRELTCSLKGPPKQDSMVQSMWLDDSDCTPSTSSSPGSRLLPSSSVAGSTGKGKGSKAEAQHHNTGEGKKTSQERRMFTLQEVKSLMLILHLLKERKKVHLYW
ncbi:rap1 GTPase-activating protein 1-like [Chamaea fasciata]|uniref:rap1 GTPase-activating protein 1-like n=1 Tax=Chamaea fasciata TaxID=190680 RepID=UPI00336A9B12